MAARPAAGGRELCSAAIGILNIVIGMFNWDIGSFLLVPGPKPSGQPRPGTRNIGNVTSPSRFVNFQGKIFLAGSRDQPAALLRDAGHGRPEGGPGPGSGGAISELRISLKTG